MMWFDLYW